MTGWKMPVRVAILCVTLVAFAFSKAVPGDCWVAHKECFGINWATVTPEDLKGGDATNVRDSRGATPLHMAAALNADPAVIAELVKIGADVNARDSGSEATPLHWAIRNDADHLIVAELLKLGADVNAQSDFGTPLFTAIDLLIRDSKRFTKLGKILGVLLVADADVNAGDKSGVTVLHLAAKHNLPVFVDFFVENGANIKAKDSNGNTPFDYADAGTSGLKKTEAYLALKRAEEQILAKEKVRKEEEERVARLEKERQFKLNAQLRTAIEENDDPTAIAEIVAQGAEINAHTEEGITPLHLAAENSNNPAVIAELVNLGGDVNAVTKDNHTPLHFAAEKNGNLIIIVELINQGAEINAHAKDGATPLHLAAEKSDNPAVIAELAKLGGKVNATDKNNYTPLHIAAHKNGNPAVVAEFLNLGANTEARTNDGLIPLDLAGGNEALKNADVYLRLEQAEEQRITKEKARKQEDERLARLRAKRLEEERIAEEKRIAEAKIRKQEEDRLAQIRAKRLEAERLAEEKRLARLKEEQEAERLAEERRIAEEKSRKEEEERRARLAEEKRLAKLEEERLATPEGQCEKLLKEHNSLAWDIQVSVCQKNLFSPDIYWIEYKTLGNSIGRTCIVGDSRIFIPALISPQAHECL
jgi:ankyrin repeat protein